jgi:hypothetical protein
MECRDESNERSRWLQYLLPQPHLALYKYKSEKHMFSDPFISPFLHEHHHLQAIMTLVTTASLHVQQHDEK